MSFDDESLETIYSDLVSAFTQHTSPSIFNIAKQLAKATVALYRGVSNNLLPSPTKSHYTFNIRDVAKVFQGILAAPADAIVRKVKRRDRHLDDEGTGSVDSSVGSRVQSCLW